MAGKTFAQRMAGELVEFINNSPTAFNAAANISALLLEKGFIMLDEGDKWELLPGGKYFVCRNDSSIIAFRVGTEPLSETGARLAAAHTDSPCFKLKPGSDTTSAGVKKCTVETYGGPILSTWLDRELGLAGRVICRMDKQVRSFVVNTGKPVAVIPNAAIHLNRDVNGSFTYNVQEHFQAIIGSGEFSLPVFFKKHFGLEEVLGYDLFFYDCQPGHIWGGDDEYITIPRLDNLAMCHAIISALLQAKDPSALSLAIMYDSEEIGSTTLMGASSAFTRDILERISLALGLDREEFLGLGSKSFLISADMAHAWHPGFMGKHDSQFAPVINGGPVVKINSQNRYVTTGNGVALFNELCQKADVPCQTFINRNDIPCGSTIGPVSSSLLSMPAVDVGNPMWAMHSARETTGVHDHWRMIKALVEFYGRE